MFSLPTSIVKTQADAIEITALSSDGIRAGVTTSVNQSGSTPIKDAARHCILNQEEGCLRIANEPTATPSLVRQPRCAKLTSLFELSGKCPCDLKDVVQLNGIMPARHLHAHLNQKGRFPTDSQTSGGRIHASPPSPLMSPHVELLFIT